MRHYVHARAAGPALPLVLSHGWPDSFWRYTKVIPLLTDPPDPADHRDEDHKSGPVVHRERGVGRDADFLQEDEPANHRGAERHRETADGAARAQQDDAPLRPRVIRPSRIHL